MRNSLSNFVLLKKSYRFLQTALYGTKGHVLIGGGTGFIGRNLKEFLLKEKYEVTIVSRVKTGEKHLIHWTDLVTKGIPDNVNAVVNLSGEPIMVPFKRFGNAFKNKIWMSRVGSTMLLTDIINISKCKPNVFITITSTDMYPSYGIHTENFIPTEQLADCNFFTRLGNDWEKASESFPSRRISIRTGMVLGHNDGSFKYNTAFSLIAQVGDGCQHQPWIHMCDLLNLILFSIEEKQISGILNGVSPKSISNGELTTVYTHMLKKSSLNVPRILLKKMYGKERTNLISEGRKVLPTRTLKYGFQFKYCEIEDALKNLFGNLNQK